MSKITEIQVSTQQETLMRLKELPRPLVMILFGADCDYKSVVQKEIQYTISDLAVELDGELQDAKLQLSIGVQRENVLIMMESASSWEVEMRHRWTRVARRSGAKSVVGILVKPKRALPSKTDEITRQFFEQNLPDASEFDKLIVVEE